MINCTARTPDQVCLSWQESALFGTDRFQWRLRAVPAAQITTLNKVVARCMPAGRYPTIAPHAKADSTRFDLPGSSVGSVLVRDVHSR